jgi:hypothetical protein
MRAKNNNKPTGVSSNYNTTQHRTATQQQHTTTTKVQEQKHFTCLNKRLALLFAHPLPVSGVHKAVDVTGPRAAQGELLLHQSASQRDLIHLAALIWVPASADHTSHHAVFVVVANLAHEIGARLHSRKAAQLSAANHNNSKVNTKK